jgi:anaphase-promoting complex subunit 5
MFQSLMDVQYLLSVVYHNLSREKERDTAAIRHAATAETAKKTQAQVVDTQAEEILQVVSLIGAGLASRK